MKDKLRAAVEFLRNDDARNLLGLHKLRVDGELVTRGELADLLHTELIRLNTGSDRRQDHTKPHT